MLHLVKPNEPEQPETASRRDQLLRFLKEILESELLLSQLSREHRLILASALGLLKIVIPKGPKGDEIVETMLVYMRRFVHDDEFRGEVLGYTGQFLNHYFPGGAAESAGVSAPLGAQEPSR